MSPSIFLSPYVLLSSSSLDSPLSSSKMPLFYISDAGPSLAKNSRPFNAPNSKRKPRYTATKRSYATVYQRLLDSFFAGSLQCRTSMLLRRATPQRGVLHRCVLEAIAFLLIFFSASDLSFALFSFLFAYYIACPAKHYNMED